MSNALLRHTTLLFGLAGLIGPTHALSRGVAATEICDRAAEEAAQNSDVPLEVLMAISRVETGRAQSGMVTPWPWAINQGGQGYWFDDVDQAIAFANDQLVKGEENFDVGCFQINLHWHGENFGSLTDAFDPQTNAAYAAQFLTALFQSEGGWPEAVAAYHSRTPAEAEAYLAKVESALVDLRAQAGVPSASDQLIAMAEPVQPRVNRFPLLQSGGRGSGASLVPITDGGVPLFAAAP